MKKVRSKKNLILKSLMALSMVAVMLNPYSVKRAYGLQKDSEDIEYAINLQEIDETGINHEQWSNNSVLLTQMDYNTSKVLEGIEFKIVDENGKNVRVGLKTDKSGEIAVNDLKPGKYSFIETKAIKGYAHDCTPMAFTISNNQSETVQVQLFSKAEKQDNDSCIKTSSKNEKYNAKVKPYEEKEVKSTVFESVVVEDEKVKDDNSKQKVVNEILLATKVNYEINKKPSYELEENKHISNVEKLKLPEIKNVDYFPCAIILVVSASAIFVLKKFKTK